MLQDNLHPRILKNLPGLRDWFLKERSQLDIPIYSSYDIRDGGFKIANVDANIYPAGFNNICNVDRENAGDVVRYYIRNHYEQGVRRVLLLTEEHTNNPFYWENISALKKILQDGDLEVCVAIPRAKGKQVMTTASGLQVEVASAEFQNGRFVCESFQPDLVVSNNDFSEFYAEWGQEILNPMNPPRELGWYQRKKSTYFKHYNALASEFAEKIGVDPWTFTVETELMQEFDIASEDSRKDLAARADALLKRVAQKQQDHGVNSKPFIFVKNNSGTYGLGVMRVHSAEEVLALNYKTRKKMKAAKGGRDVDEVILQEGVPTTVRADSATAEPTIYLLGCQLLGGFLRSHAEKDETESLNSPGAVYKRLCVSDLKVSEEGNPLENVYGWIGKLGALAIGRESREMGVVYKGYSRHPLKDSGVCADPKLR